MAIPIPSLLAGLVGALTVFVALPSMSAEEMPSKARKTAQVFTNIISISIIQHDPGTTNQISFTITNKADVARIAGSVRLEADPVGRRWDLHLHDCIFQTPTDKIVVQFCNECFDLVVDSSGGVKHFKMPKDFYRDVWTEIQKRPKDEQWTLLPP